jgi:hypothetical protein
MHASPACLAPQTEPAPNSVVRLPLTYESYTCGGTPLAVDLGSFVKNIGTKMCAMLDLLREVVTEMKNILWFEREPRLNLDQNRGL